ncbi:MAG: hypothetical protein WBA74_10480 [Cyclobacteriaceae bacterium]
MTKNAPLIVIFLSIGLLLACTNSTEVDGEVELPQSDVSEKVLDMIVMEQEKEKALVRHHYNLLSTKEKSNISFNQYYANLAQSYQRATKLALDDAQSLDINESPELQVEQIQSELINETNIPEWYWEMKQSTKEKIVNMTLQNH